MGVCCCYNHLELTEDIPDEIHAIRYDKLVSLYIHLKRHFVYHGAIIQQLLTTINIFTQDNGFLDFAETQRYITEPLVYLEFDKRAIRGMFYYIEDISSWYKSYSNDFQLSYRRFLNAILFTDAVKYY